MAEGPYACRILRVDLGNGNITREKLDPALLRQHIGGSGVAIKLLYDEVPPGVEPYDPRNRLIFATGPFTGTRMPGSGTFTVATRGPVTNLLASAQANGFFGARMRFAGYEALVVQGAAPEWTYLWIHDGEAELRRADHLLGLDVWDTQERLAEELGEPRTSVACIGPSGENLVRFAGICCDRGHIASSNGPGAVMGSKKLKAIAVHGRISSVAVGDPERTNALARGAFLENAEQSMMGKTVKGLGTNGNFARMAALGSVAIKNLTTNVWPGLPAFHGEAVRTHYQRKPRPCWACPWSHCAEIKVAQGPHAGFEGEEPEFEGFSAWGPLVGVEDVVSAVKLSTLNDRMGMDLKECGFTVAMAIECYENGVIGPRETGGLELRWGNADAIGKLIEDIAHRRGFGDLLAEGVMRAAQQIGGEAPNCAVFIKNGYAPHTLDPRGNWPLSFSLSLSENGSFAGMAGLDPDVGNLEPVKRHNAEAIPVSMSRGVRRWTVNDTLGLCEFFLYGRLGPTVEALGAVTGWDFTLEELLEVGERMAALGRAFNIRHGLRPEKDDTVSPRLASAPVDGPAEGKAIGPVHAQVAREYYRAMGWDEETSKPLPGTLRRLGLDHVVNDIWQ